jgi:hypothetical protein
MINYRITVCSVNWYSCKLLTTLIENLNQKSEFPQQIKYLIIDNTDGKDNDIKILKKMPFPIEIIPYTPPSRKKSGSFAHAAALNYALSIIDTEFTLITDPDVFLFKEKWDSLCIQLIDEKKNYAVGTSFPEWQLGKFHNFPNAVFCFFNTRTFIEIGADWTPYSEKVIVNLFHRIRRILLRFGILINRTRYQKYQSARKIFKKWENLIGVCSHDTGYKIAKQAKNNNFLSMTFENYAPGKIFKQSQPESIVNLAEHFELYYYDGMPILTHRYSTRSKVWETPRGGDHEFWIKNIEQYEKIKDS